MTVATPTSDHDEPEALPENPCPRHARTPGAPVWCHPCGDRVLAAIDALPQLAGELALRGVSDAGRLAATGVAGRETHAKVTGSPSGSPAWDAADEIVEWAHGVADALRAHLRHSRMQNTTRLHGTGVARVLQLEGAVHYLRAWGSALLAAPYAEQWGREALELARRAERAAGFDRLVHRLPAPCPSCDRLTLTREDGADQVECRACGRVWTEDDYRRLVVVVAQDYRDVTGGGGRGR